MHNAGHFARHGSCTDSKFLVEWRRRCRLYLGPDLERMNEFVDGADFATLRRALPEEWIAEALEAKGVATIRRRRLPAEQVVWLVLGMCFFREHSIEFLVQTLGISLPGSRPGAVAKSAIPPARARVGSDPLESLFQKSARKWAHHGAARDRWRGLSLYALDGTTLRVPDSDANDANFGRTRTGLGSGGAAYPMVRVTALMALRSHMIAAASFGGVENSSEFSLAESLWSELPDESLVIVDRGLFSKPVFHALESSGGRHWLIRAKSNTVWTEVEKDDKDDKDDFLVELPIWPKAREKNSELPETLRARAIRYQHPGEKPSVLLTSLLDRRRFPAKEIVKLYHERWEIEIGYDEIKTHMLQREEAIRSRTAEGIKQEIWGLLLAYNMIRLEIERAAAEINVSPLRISFVHAMRSMKATWLVAATLHAPGRYGERLRSLREDVKLLLLPERRSERRVPRQVKMKANSKYRYRGKKGRS